MKDQADELRKMMSMKDKRPQRIISIASGKGGVGKTNIAINLSIALQQLGQNVILVDAEGTIETDNRFIRPDIESG